MEAYDPWSNYNNWGIAGEARDETQEDERMGNKMLEKATRSKKNLLRRLNVDVVSLALLMLFLRFLNPARLNVFISLEKETYPTKQSLDFLDSSTNFQNSRFIDKIHCRVFLLQSLKKMTSRKNYFYGFLKMCEFNETIKMRTNFNFFRPKIHIWKCRSRQQCGLESNPFRSPFQF